jgi:hypothetical protein
MVRSGVGITSLFKSKLFYIGLLIGAIVGLVTYWKDIVAWWEKSSPAVKILVGILGGLVGVIGTIITVTEAWSAVQSILNMKLFANPIGLVIAAIAALVVGIIALIEYWDILWYKMNNMEDWMKESKFMKYLGYFTGGSMAMAAAKADIDIEQGNASPSAAYTDGLKKIQDERDKKGGGPISQMFNGGAGAPAAPGPNGALKPDALQDFNAMRAQGEAQKMAELDKAAAVSTSNTNSVNAQVANNIVIQDAKDPKATADTILDVMKKNFKQVAAEASNNSKQFDMAQRSSSFSPI